MQESMMIKMASQSARLAKMSITGEVLSLPAQTANNRLAIPSLQPTSLTLHLLQDYPPAGGSP